MNIINKLLEIISIADIIIMLVFNFLNSTGEDTSSQVHKKRTIIANIVFLIVLLTGIFVSKALNN
jgi:hypothetical protein